MNETTEDLNTVLLKIVQRYQNLRIYHRKGTVTIKTQECVGHGSDIITALSNLQDFKNSIGPSKIKWVISNILQGNNLDE